MSTLRAVRGDTGGLPPVRTAVVATVVTAAALTGALERWWVASHPIGGLTSDGAVIGLMGMQLLKHGQLTAYMWGQAYGGSIEAILTAGVFGVAGTGVSQLVATTALSSALVALAIWWAGRRIVGDTAAVLGALCWWVWPASFIWRSLKPGGTYMLGLALAVAAVGALARIRAGETGWQRLAAAGALIGLAFWSSPMSLQLLVPAVLWCVVQLLRLGRRLAIVVGAFLVGTLPAIWFGFTHGWSNFHLPGPSNPFAAVPTHLEQFFKVEAPLVMSLRVQKTLSFVGGPLGVVLALCAAAGFVAVLFYVVTGRSKRCVLPVTTLLVLPVLYAFNPLTSRAAAARYAMFAATMAMLLLGVGLESSGGLLRRAARARGSLVKLLPAGVGLAALAALGAFALGETPLSVVKFPAPDVTMPIDDSGLQSLVATHHIHYAFAPYWIAYRITFETKEATNATAYDYDRYPPFGAVVRASPAPAYLFVTASPTLGRFESWCRAHAVAYRAWSKGGYSVVQPSSRVLPSELPKGVL